MNALPRMALDKLMPDMPDARVFLDPGFLDRPRADRFLERLREGVEWEQHAVKLFGREVPCPRLSAWYGDAHATYRYSGFRHAPRPWTPDLQELRSAVEAASGAAFNSVLLNLYRDGADAMGWHADDEPELGPEPVIASVSLGAARRLRFRHRTRRDLKTEVLLTHGSLLVMAGATQQHWQHAIPRSRTVSEPRINLTFRLIVPVGRG